MRILQEKKNEDFDGYWYYKGKFIHLEAGEEHLSYLLDHYSEFGISEIELERFFEKWNTNRKKFKIDLLEMGDREFDFMMLALNRGAVRVRFYNDSDVPDGVFAQLTFSKLKEAGNCLIDEEKEFLGWPIFLNNAKTGEGNDFRNIDEAIVFCYD